MRAISRFFGALLSLFAPSGSKKRARKSTNGSSRMPTKRRSARRGGKPRSTSSRPVSSGRCGRVTDRGRPCRNHNTPGKDHCFLHAGKKKIGGSSAVVRPRRQAPSYSSSVVHTDERVVKHAPAKRPPGFSDSDWNTATEAQRRYAVTGKGKEAAQRDTSDQAWNSFFGKPKSSPSSTNVASGGFTPVQVGHQSPSHGADPEYDAHIAKVGRRVAPKTPTGSSSGGGKTTNTNHAAPGAQVGQQANTVRGNVNVTMSSERARAEYDEHIAKVGRRIVTRKPDRDGD